MATLAVGVDRPFEQSERPVIGFIYPVNGPGCPSALEAHRLNLFLRFKNWCDVRYSIYDIVPAFELPSFRGIEQRSTTKRYRNSRLGQCRKYLEVGAS